MKCKLCSREAVNNKYCDLHEKAYRNLMEKFEVWKQALEISWKEYLSEIVKNPYAGEWAKEVAEELLKSEENHDKQD
ncbi:MAG: hypothetical protein QXN63_02995 [Candidatus Bathyarchaeia archaeon]